MPLIIECQLTISTSGGIQTGHYRLATTGGASPVSGRDTRAQM
jgi:hypothetical protein